MRKFAILFLFTGAMLHAQISNPSVRYVSVAPSGSCAASPPIQIVISTGVTYTCNNGTWGAIGGSGSGTVNSGTTGQIGYYAANGTTISGENALWLPLTGGTMTGTLTGADGGTWGSGGINSTAVTIAGNEQLADTATGGTVTYLPSTIPVTASTQTAATWNFANIVMPGSVVSAPIVWNRNNTGTVTGNGSNYGSGGDLLGGGDGLSIYTTGTLLYAKGHQAYLYWSGGSAGTTNQGVGYHTHLGLYGTNQTVVDLSSFDDAVSIGGSGNSVGTYTDFKCNNNGAIAATKYCLNNLDPTSEIKTVGPVDFSAATSVILPTMVSTASFFPWGEPGYVGGNASTISSTAKNIETFLLFVSTNVSFDRMVFNIKTAATSNCGGGSSACGLAVSIKNTALTSDVCVATTAYGGSGTENINATGYIGLTFASGSGVSGGVCSLAAGNYYLVLSSESATLQMLAYFSGNGYMSFRKAANNATSTTNVVATGAGSTLAIPADVHSVSLTAISDAAGNVPILWFDGN